MFRAISPKGKSNPNAPERPTSPRDRSPEQGTKSLDLGFFSQATFYKFHNDRNHGDANDKKDHQTEVVLHKGQVSKKISCSDEQAGPDKAPEHIVKEK